MPQVTCMQSNMKCGTCCKNISYSWAIQCPVHQGDIPAFGRFSKHFVPRGHWFKCFDPL